VEALLAPPSTAWQRMATTTIHKRIQFARQLMHDAVDWKIIEENPFLFPFFLTTEHTEYTDVGLEFAGICFRVFRVVRG
jgi:hypothetical protein